MTATSAQIPKKLHPSDVTVSPLQAYFLIKNISVFMYILYIYFICISIG